MIFNTLLFEVVDGTTKKPVVNLERIALDEEWAKGLVYCDISGWAMTDDGCLMLMDDCNNVAFPPIGRFEVIWHHDL